MDESADRIAQRSPTQGCKRNVVNTIKKNLKGPDKVFPTLEKLRDTRYI